MTQVKNILFIRLRLLGDIIFTIPSIQILKQHFPQARVHYVVEEAFRQIGELLPGVDNLMVIPRKIGVADHFKFRKDVRALEIDTVVDFHCGPKSALLTRLTGVSTRIGYQTPNRNYAYTHRSPRKLETPPTHSTYNQAKLLKHLGIETITPESIPPYPAVDVPGDQVSEALKTAIQETASGPRAVIHVGAGSRFRDWGLENFAALIQRLTGRQIEVFLVGNNPEEKRKGGMLARDYPVYDLTGRLSIPETLHLISQSQVFFGVDSGPLHLATLTPTPVVTVYGPNLPEISGPWRRHNVTLIQQDLPCRPCSQKGCPYDTIRCMKSISSDDVYEAINQYI